MKAGKKLRKNLILKFFLPIFEELIKLRIEEANQISDKFTPWETLAQPFEPDLTLEWLNKIFQPLKETIPSLLSELKKSEKNKWDLNMSVNGKSQLILINSLMNQLSENNEGSIVNISDQKIASPNPDYLSYTASRFAMMGMTNALALGLAPRARINSVAPGHTLASPDQTDSGLIKAQKQSPLGRGPTPDEIAESVTFLMNNKSITGQTIFVDCGERLLSRKRDIVFETEE